MYEAALDRLGEGRALAVGDRLEVDVLGARRTGLDAALVLTGGGDARAGGRGRSGADARGATRSPGWCSGEPWNRQRTSAARTIA